MTSYMKVFWDMEFTGLHQNTTPVSIGLVAENGMKFYAEFTDYDESQLDDWLKENVISNLVIHAEGNYKNIAGDVWEVKGDRRYVTEYLDEWLKRLGKVEMWSDCLAYDWMLFSELFGGALNLPANIYYIPLDISTLFRVKGVDPDISREAFAKMGGMKHNREVSAEVLGMKHNALHDADIICRCYYRLIAMENEEVRHFNIEGGRPFEVFAQILHVKGPMTFTQDEIRQMQEFQYKEPSILEKRIPEDLSVTLQVEK